jgi:hypothetical protein
MCDPVSLGIAAVSAGVSIYGASKSAAAQKDAANATAQQNLATQKAQNEGFGQRLAATGAQTDAQIAARKATLGNEQQIADAMRARQTSAFQQQQDVLGAANQQEEGFRNIGYNSADLLMDRTSGANLGQAQTDWQTQAARLLDTADVGALHGDGGVGGTGDDPYTKAALARRAAEAAGDIRAYGAKTAKIGSYAAPLQLVQNSIQDSETGIMPASLASKLLQSSTPILMAPSQTNWQQAAQYGQAAGAAAEASGQSQMGIADLQYRNSTDLANLQQSDATTTAANIAEQAKANAAYKAAMGGLISGIGNLGMYGAGYYGKIPGFLQTGGAPTPSKVPEIISI